MFLSFFINLFLGKVISKGKDLLRDNLGKPIDIRFGDEHILKPGAIGTKIFDYLIGQDQGKELRLYMFLIKQDK